MSWIGAIKDTQVWDVIEGQNILFIYKAIIKYKLTKLVGHIWSG